MDTKHQLTPEERRTQILAAGHAFTQEMESLGIKYATVIYDETLQTEDGMRIYTVGNLPQELVDWLLNAYVLMLPRREIISTHLVRFDEQQLPA